jgi:predicted DCC family thiol-disulfide oxidoreductase YuxK
VVEGVEVFRRAYAAVGLGWLLAPTRWPGLRRASDAAYRWFARNRLRLTGRPAPCDAERCRVA